VEDPEEAFLQEGCLDEGLFVWHLLEVYPQEKVKISFGPVGGHELDFVSVS